MASAGGEVKGKGEGREGQSGVYGEMESGEVEEGGGRGQWEEEREGKETIRGGNEYVFGKDRHENGEKRKSRKLESIRNPEESLKTCESIEISLEELAKDP